MRVVVQSSYTALAGDIGDLLQEHGFDEVGIESKAAEHMQLRHGTRVCSRDLLRLMRVLRPYQLGLQADEALDATGVDAVVELGPEQPLDEVLVTILSDSETHAAKVRDALEAEGLSVLCVNLRSGLQPGVRFLDVDAFTRSLVRSTLAPLELDAHTLTECDGVMGSVVVMAPDPSLAEVPPKQRYGVKIRSDDIAVACALTDSLRARGFESVKVELWGDGEVPDTGIKVTAGPFAESLEGTELFTHVQRTCRVRGVDAGRYPVRQGGAATGTFDATIDLPIAACLEGKLRPYAGTYPERFQLRIFGNGGPVPDSLAEELTRAGFPPQSVDERGDGRHGFAVCWGSEAEHPTVTRAVTEVVKKAMRSLGASPEFPLTFRRLSADETDIHVYFPTKGLSDGSLMERYAHPAPYSLTIKTDESSQLEPLAVEFGSWGFQSCELEECPVPDSPLLQHGGAPAHLISRICEFLRKKTGLRLRARQAWPAEDRDIWLSVPSGLIDGISEGTSSEDADTEPAAARAEDWMRAEEDSDTPIPAFLSVATDDVRIGDLVLPRQLGPAHPLVPSGALFEHYCVDNTTAVTLQHVGRGVLLSEPCLLEGETSTSKTSCLLFLAHLLNQPVLRVNLSGQTDTGELIGRFAPCASGSELGGSAPSWRWQDGLVVQAMRDGMWLILDEINLAEPQILERLNSVLERPPSLVLTEHDNAVLGGGGEPVHPNFQIFATMNPAEYVGRSALSPAYRNRWRSHCMVPSPGESEYRQMLRQLVLGEAPSLTVEGSAYDQPSRDAPFARVVRVPQVDRFLDALAKFHASLEVMSSSEAGRTVFGAGRQERYVFTRRDLLSVLEFLAHPEPSVESAVWNRRIRTALTRYYVARVKPGSDRDVIENLLNAAGIGPQTWTLSDDGIRAERETE